MKYISRLFFALILLMTVSSCKIPFFGVEDKPVVTISNAVVERNFDDEPKVTVNYTVTFPNDAYTQTAGDIGVVCTLTQKRTHQANRVYNGPSSHLPNSQGKGPFTGTAEVTVPQDAKYMNGYVTITCKVAGVLDDNSSNTLSVDIPKLLCPQAYSMDEDTVCTQPQPTPTEQPSPTAPAYDYDKPFATPQYFIHVTGHGTTSGPVVDDAWWLYPSPPGADGTFLVADGSGGTYTYSADRSGGPYATPRQICTAAYSVGLPNTQSWSAWNYSDYFDCQGVY